MPYPYDAPPGPIETLARYLAGEQRPGTGRPTDQCVSPLRLAKLDEDPWTVEEQTHIKGCAYCQRRIGGMYISFCPAQEELEQFVALGTEYFLASSLGFHLGERTLGDTRFPCPTCAQKVQELRTKQIR